MIFFKWKIKYTVFRNRKQVIILLHRNVCVFKKMITTSLYNASIHLPNNRRKMITVNQNKCWHHMLNFKNKFPSFWES